AGVEERAAKLVEMADRAAQLRLPEKDRPDPRVVVAAHALLGGPAVEEVTVPAPQGGVWRDPVLGMSFVWVPPERFWMGSSKEPGARGFDPEAYDDETPGHEVELSQGLWVAEHPVTNAQYGAFAAGSKGAEPARWQNRRFNGPEQPVVGV